eukprot:gene5201-5855_t
MLGHRKGVVVATLNVNSLLHHIDEIRLIIKDLGIHILAINETKLDGSIADDLVGVQGYSIKRCDRNRNGGGVAIYVKDNLFDKYTIRDDVPVSSIEAVCVECKPSHSAPFIILALYRPPDESVEFFSELKKTLHFLDNENKELILLGDTNCDILAEYSSNEQSSTNSLPAHSKRLLEIYSLFGFQQLIRKAYRNLRNRANKMNEHLKREFFTKKIAEHDGDLKNTWKTINQVLNKKSKTTHISSLEVEGKTVSGDSAIAESMNQFFCEIGRKLSDKITDSSNPLLTNEYEVNPGNFKFNLEHISILEIERVLGKFDTSNGFGPDGLASFFIKIGFPVIAESLYVLVGDFMSKCCLGLVDAGFDPDKVVCVLFFLHRDLAVAVPSGALSPWSKTCTLDVELERNCPWLSLLSNFLFCNLDAKIKIYVEKDGRFKCPLLQSPCGGELFFGARDLGLGASEALRQHFGDFAGPSPELENLQQAPPGYPVVGRLQINKGGHEWDLSRTKGRILLVIAPTERPRYMLGSCFDRFLFQVHFTRDIFQVSGCVDPFQTSWLKTDMADNKDTSVSI